MTIQEYNQSISGTYKDICDTLFNLLADGLSESTSRVWHGSPVWFIDENPIVGYSAMNDGVKLLFWSRQSLNDPLLTSEGSFMAAGIIYSSLSDIDRTKIDQWTSQAKNIQWDYKNLIKKQR